MRKKSKIIIVGVLLYWVIALLIHKLFEHIDVSLEFLKVLFSASVSPFILGFLISFFLDTNKGWIYAGVSYIIYFFWVYILGWVFDLQLNEFVKHFSIMLKVYIYLGSIATLFATFGGIVGYYVRKKTAQKKVFNF